MVWWYDEDDWLKKMEHSCEYFETKQLSYFVSCYNKGKNIQDWIKKIKNRDKCLGIICSTWEGFEQNKYGIEYTAQLSWKGD